jgi:hypothetical protein
MTPVLDHRHRTLSSLARNIDTENEDDRVFFFPSFTGRREEDEELP